MYTIPIYRARVHLQEKALIGIGAGDFLDVDIKEGILFLQTLLERGISFRLQRSNDAELPFLLGFGDNFIVAGLEDISPGFSFLLGLEQGGTRRCRNNYGVSRPKER